MASKRAPRVTLLDVARASGVSPSTVSRALKGHPRIPAETQERVRKEAARLNYVPNAAAQSLRNRRARAFGLLIEDFADPVHGQIAAGFEAGASEGGFTVISASGLLDLDREKRALNVFIQHRLDGVALVSSSLTPRIVGDAASESPVVFLNPEASVFVAAGEPLPDGLIAIDETSGVHQLVHHLIERGYRSIGYVQAGTNASNVVRRQATADAVRDAGLQHNYRCYVGGPDTWRDAAELVEVVLADPPDALVCYDDKLALAVMSELRRSGVDVPGEMAVCGFDGIPFAAMAGLTTVSHPAIAAGRLLAEILVNVVDHDVPLPAPQVLPVVLTIRDTTPPRTPHS